MRTKKLDLSTINKETLEILCKSSQGNIRNIADKLGISIYHLMNLAAQYNVEMPSMAQIQFATLNAAQKAKDTQIPKDSYNFLVYDDVTYKTINGIDVNGFRVEQSIKMDSVWKYFHKTEPLCCFTAKKTDLVFYFYDNNPQNFLITNFDWIHRKYFESNFAFLPYCMADVTADFKLCLPEIKKKKAVTLHVIIEKLLNTNEPTVINNATEKMVKFWVSDVLNGYNVARLFPSEVRPTYELLLIWIWKQLTHNALLKGVRELKLETEQGVFSINAEHILSLVMTALKSKQSNIYF